jgi:AAA+ ATPase superfamily predicted ATPase
MLKNEPSYPRRLSAVLGKREQKIVVRLRQMEKAGLLKSSWGRKAGNNVKVYELINDRIELVIGVDGLEIVLHPAERRQDMLPPLYLPPKIQSDPSFVGRSKELKLISSRSRFIILEGIAGIGKSSLLQAFCRNLARGNVLFWHVFTETDTINQLLRKMAVFLAEFDYINLLEYMKTDGRDNSTILDLLIKGLDRDKHVLVFDDYQRHQDEGIDSLFRYLQQNVYSAKVVVASRVRPNFLISSSNLLEVNLDGLNLEETLQLLQARHVKLGTEQAALAYEKTSGHPLVLTLLCAILKRGPITKSSLERLPLDNLMDELLRSLSNEERSLLLELSAFRNPIPLRGIAILNRRGVRYLLHTLQRKLILQETGEYFQLHELIREGCYTLIDNPENLHKKIGLWYITNPGTQEILEGLYHLVKGNDHEGVIRIMGQEFFDEKFRFVENGYSRSVLSILEPVAEEDFSAETKCWLLCLKGRALADIHMRTSARALLRKAKSIAESLNNPRLLGCVNRTMGREYLQEGNLAKAEKSLLLSSQLLRRVGDITSLERVYLDLARLHFAKGDVEESLKYVNLNKQGPEKWNF